MFLYKLFWLVGAGVIVWALVKKVSLTWYEWVLGVLGWLLGLFALQNWGASLLEAEPRAAGLFLLIVGLPALILLALAVVLPMMRAKKA